MLRYRRLQISLFLVAALAAGSAHAGVVTLEADRDTSLYEEDGTQSNGSGIFLFSGKTLEFNARRALLRFDVAGGVPRGVTVTSVSLEMWCNQAPPFGSETASFTLHPLSADWGEAGSDAGDPGGLGAPAESGDATWTERFFGLGQPWGSPGGDIGAASASASVTGICAIDAPIDFEFETTPELVADVQAWLNDPGNNFGWALVGNEDEPITARRFLSRDASALQPMLKIEYGAAEVPATTHWGGAVAALLILGLFALTLRRSAIPSR